MVRLPSVCHRCVWPCVWLVHHGYMWQMRGWGISHLFRITTRGKMFLVIFAFDRNHMGMVLCVSCVCQDASHD